MNKSAMVVALALGSALVSSSALASLAQREGIRSVVTTHRGEIRGCYKKVLVKRPDLEGELVVDWTVNDKGAAQDVTINEAKSTLNDSLVEACVVDKFKSWKFPSAPKGQVVTVSYPLVFTN